MWGKEWVVVGIWLGAGEEGVSILPKQNFALILALEQLRGQEGGLGEDRGLEDEV